MFAREKDLAVFASKNNLPVIVDNCPACFASPTERLRMKHLLAAQEYEFPNTMPTLSKVRNIEQFQNFSLFPKALLPLISRDRVDSSPKLEIAHTEDACEGMCPRVTPDRSVQ